MEEIIAEMAPPPEPSLIHRKKRLIISVIIVLFIFITGLFSWWLSAGKISSVSAYLDASIFTVGSESQAMLKEIYVIQGELVSANQPLGLIETKNSPLYFSGADIDMAAIKKLAGLSNDYDTPESVERDLSIKLNQAREEEEKAKKIYQDTVAEHVRAQLARRSMNQNNSAYKEANRREAQAKARMDGALENFERISQYRASVDQTLNRFYAVLLRIRKNSKGQVYPATLAQHMPSVSQLISPIAGRIFRINAAQGQQLKPGENVFYILPEDSENKKWIQASFPASDKDKIKPGQNVTIRFDKYNLHLSGNVQHIGSEMQMQLQQNGAEQNISSKLYVPVRININNLQKISDIPIGTMAECQIQTHYILSSSFF